MNGFRISQHPILTPRTSEDYQFLWNGQPFTARQGETIMAALFANGVHVFGHHPKDGSPQGIFCANGQCSQCMVIANGLPIKACMELATPGMVVNPVEGLPALPKNEHAVDIHPIQEIQVPVLIIGGGPSGLSAAIELGKYGIHTLIVDDKHRLGGKLVLQTHRFFGSKEDVFAGTRGIDIATKLEAQVRAYDTNEVWTHSIAVAVFSDRKVGVLRNGKEYVLIKPDILLVSSGAREKSLAFKGNTLPGVYGAGAFQTLVNFEMVRPTQKLFIVGGGNVGLIAGYHALQAGIAVVGLVEALPECGGYKVHRDKLARMGVPIYTSHTVLSANGDKQVESVTIAAVNQKFEPIAGTEKSFACDTVLIAVGLDSVNEFYHKALAYGMEVYVAGDAEEIAEASAAIFSGKIRGIEIARQIGAQVPEIPKEWQRMADILKSRPGNTGQETLPEQMEGTVPVLHCSQEIPCNPCAFICAKNLIQVNPNDIRAVPVYTGDTTTCKGCEQCVFFCPGLAITVVDFDYSPTTAQVTIPYEFLGSQISAGDQVVGLDTLGNELGVFNVLSTKIFKKTDRTTLVRIETPKNTAGKLAGIRIQNPEITEPLQQYVRHISDDIIVCRCERVTAGEIRDLIRQGYRDINEIKTISRAGMGACGSKTCGPLVQRIFREEGIPENEIVLMTHRPLFVEVPLGIFAGVIESQSPAPEGKQ